MCWVSEESKTNDENEGSYFMFWRRIEELRLAQCGKPNGCFVLRFAELVESEVHIGNMRIMRFNVLVHFQTE